MNMQNYDNHEFWLHFSHIQTVAEMQYRLSRLQKIMITVDP